MARISYTLDGETVYGFVHDEFHAGPGTNMPSSLCPNGDANDCWYSSVLAAKSTDGGRSFRLVPGNDGPSVVVAAPIPYVPSAGVQGTPQHREIVRNPHDSMYVGVTWPLQICSATAASGAFGAVAYLRQCDATRPSCCTG